MKMKTTYEKVLALSKTRKKQIAELRKASMTWAEIGAALGISRQRAQQLGAKK